ncbi:hypothetical protein GCM10022277_18450 [Litoribacillus peritrichatus]|uniref:Uncharacterized protein n=2 Tax=Litoribacillus peritrichatus TaxID=718191 RepID=A0ABP7MH29_9GAMM
MAQDPLPQAAGTPGITGVYLGKHALTMNTMDENAMNALVLPRTNLNGVEYIVLGNSISDALWQWDFDNHRITWGGDNLFAMGMVKTPYQPYAQETIALKTGNLETFPTINNINEVTMDFTDNGDGTYTAEYAQKIHLSMQNYPMAATSTTFRITQTADDKLDIVTIDHEDGELDGVPGTQIEGVFPYVVQPQFDSTEMHLELGTDSNDDGITDLAANLLGLEAATLDSDGDGLSDADEIGVFVRPTDTDHDGIADIHEPGDVSELSDVIGGIKLITGETVAVESRDDIAFSFSTVTALNLTLDAVQVLDGEEPPIQSEDGKTFHYSMINFLSDSQMFEGNELAFTLTFSEGIPEGLQLSQKLLTVGFDMETMQPLHTISYPSIPWVQNANNENAIDFVIPHDMTLSRDKQLIVGHTQEPAPDETPDNAGTASEAGSKSGSGSGGGSFGWSFILALSALTLNRRKLSIKQQERR